MKNLAWVTEVASKVPRPCHVSRCRKEGCAIYLTDMSTDSITIDLDCEELGVRDRKRCDYLFIGHEGDITYVALIELKSGGVKSATDVAEQLQGGADLAAKLLPPNISCKFLPVLVKRSIHKYIYKKLREKRVKLHSMKKQITIVSCDSKLIDAFEKN